MLSFISKTELFATNGTMPAHQAGDILIICAFRNGSTTPPTAPAGWTDIGANTGTSCSCRSGYKIAASSSETSGTWTNASAIVVMVYRPTLALTQTPVIRQSGNSGASTTVTYSGITTMTDPGFSWCLRFGMISTTNTNLQTAPTGYTNRANAVSGFEVAAHDSNGAVTSVSSQNVAVGGTSGNWLTQTIEIVENPYGIDKQNTSGAIGVGFGDVGNGRDYMSMGFIAGQNNISAFSFKLNGKSGTSTQGYRMWVDNADANYHPTGGIGGIGGDTLILNSTLQTVMKRYNLSSTVPLVSGQNYCVVFAPWNTTTNAYSSDYQDWVSSNTNPFANGRRVHADTAYTTFGEPDSGNLDLVFNEWYDPNYTSSALKVLAGVAKASLKVVAGVAIASVKKVAGATN